MTSSLKGVTLSALYRQESAVASTEGQSWTLYCFGVTSAPGNYSHCFVCGSSCFVATVEGTSMPHFEALTLLNMHSVRSQAGHLFGVRWWSLPILYLMQGNKTSD